MAGWGLSWLSVAPSRSSAGRTGWRCRCWTGGPQRAPAAGPPRAAGWAAPPAGRARRPLPAAACRRRWPGGTRSGRGRDCPSSCPRGKLSRLAPAPHLAVLAALLEEAAQSTVQVRNGRPEFLLHVAGCGEGASKILSDLGCPDAPYKVPRLGAGPRPSLLFPAQPFTCRGRGRCTAAPGALLRRAAAPP